MIITNCTVDHKQNPLGYFMDVPVFGWTVEDAKGTKQKQARILVEEIDPITGDPTPCSPWYSSGMLSYIYAAERLGIAE